MALVSEGDESLQFYGDDRESPVGYTSAFETGDIVSFVLEQLNIVIAQRSSNAKELKAYQEYMEKEKERANKEWSEEQELRKKSNTILLDWANWESSFIAAREPFIIHFYESNNSACLHLNREWEQLSTDLKGRVKVAKINLTEADNHKLEDQLRLTKYPSVRFYKNGPKKINEFSLYEGVHKKFSIQEWVE